MVKRTVYAIQPSRGEWIVVRRGAPRPIHRFSRKQDAIELGVQLARDNQPSQLIIRRRDGTIQDERAYAGPLPSSRGAT